MRTLERMQVSFRGATLRRVYPPAARAATLPRVRTGRVARAGARSLRQRLHERRPARAQLVPAHAQALRRDAWSRPSALRSESLTAVTKLLQAVQPPAVHDVQDQRRPLQVGEPHLVDGGCPSTGSSRAAPSPAGRPSDPRPGRRAAAGTCGRPRPPSPGPRRAASARALVPSNQRVVYACVSSCASIRGVQDSLPASAGARTPMSRVQVGASPQVIRRVREEADARLVRVLAERADQLPLARRSSRPRPACARPMPSSARRSRAGPPAFASASAPACSLLSAITTSPLRRTATGRCESHDLLAADVAAASRRRSRTRPPAAQRDVEDAAGHDAVGRVGSADLADRADVEAAGMAAHRLGDRRTLVHGSRTRCRYRASTARRASPPGAGSAACHAARSCALERLRRACVSAAVDVGGDGAPPGRPGASRPCPR